MQRHKHDIIVKYKNVKEAFMDEGLSLVKIVIVNTDLEADELEKALEKIIEKKKEIINFYDDVIKEAEAQKLLTIPVRDFEIADIYY